MPRLLAHRATISGLGSTAALLAAVMAVSLIVGGLVAYTASPSGPMSRAQPALVVPGEDGIPGPGAGPSALVVPGSAALAGFPIAPGAGSSVRVGTPARGTTAAPGQTGPGGSGPQAAAPGPSAAGGSGAPGRPVPGGTLAGATASAAVGTAGTLNESISGVGRAVAGVSPALGPAATTTTGATGAAVQQSADTAAGVIRRLGR